MEILFYKYKVVKPLWGMTGLLSGSIKKRSVEIEYGGV